jgi:UDP-N-acetylglucosamine--N-acetylmuramyl-(pentapeptide) pyrophosphoryl-undecaprenol N-acetylglucosamine transferase
MDAMHIILAGGGTGGHLFPGVAAAQGLRALDPAVQVTWLCTDRALDAAQLDRYGLSHDVLPAPRLGGWAAWLRFPFAFVGAVRRAGAYLDERKPGVVVSLGGYGGAPAVRAAAGRGIPTILLEQNVIPGRANRYLARRALRVLTQWEESVPHFGRRAAKVEVTGNPVREEIACPDPAAARSDLGLRPDHRTLLVMGGSQGAGGINRAFETQAALVGAFRDRLQVLHLAGTESAAEGLRKAYDGAGVEAKVLVFSDRMALVQGAADFAVSRAGGTSIAELAVLGVPAALVPYPHAAEDHQRHNARAAAKGGGALVVEETDLQTEAGLRPLLERAAGEAEALAAMAERMRALGRPDARRVVAERILALASRK